MTTAPTTEGDASRARAREGAEPLVGDAKKELKTFIERIERLAVEKKAFGDDIADIYREAKSRGYDAKAMREVVRLKGQPVDKRKEYEATLETYLHALGMLD
jgi:uncharacterized protein (UPF0335 family)